MATTLDTVNGIIELPSDMLWPDEFLWTPVSIAESTTLTGALIREVSTQLYGRPITLSGSQDGPWIDWTTMEALRQVEIDQAATLDPMTLTMLDGRVFNVVFRGSTTSPAVTGNQVLLRAPVDADARAALQFVPIIRLIEIP